MWNSTEPAFPRSSSYREREDDEEALQWAELERLPTFSRVRRGFWKSSAGKHSEIDVCALSSVDRTEPIDRLLGDTGGSEQFFRRSASNSMQVSLLMTKLPVFYKHRDLHFYPPWAYTLPSWVLSIPTSLVESAI